MNVGDAFRPQAVALGCLLAIWFALTVLALGLGLIVLPEGVELPGGEVGRELCWHRVPPLHFPVDWPSSGFG